MAMNGKPDEHFDQWVRQSLDKLPDAPPPGTRFDAGRLWNQLQPELHKSATHRRFGWIGWVAAACTVGLLGWFWTNQQPDSTDRTSSVKRPNGPVAIRSQHRATARNGLSESVGVTKIRRPFWPSARRQERITSVLPTVLPDNEPAQSVAAVADLLLVLDTSFTLSIQPKPAQITAVIPLKRRFQVVHLNELQAEEAIRPSPHKTDRFVRLGTGDRGQPVPETVPTITWPLTTKLNQ